MKKIKLLSVFFLLATAVIFTSCNSDDSNDPVNIPTGTFTADMDGEPFVAMTATAMQVNGTISIAGLRNTNGELITIIAQGTTPGTYQNSFMYYTTATTNGTEYINVDPSVVFPNGSVTITSVQNGTVSGTFNFTAYTMEDGAAPIVFTNGSFENVPLTVQNTPVGNSISATLNGTPLTFMGAGVTNQNTLSVSGMNMNTMMGVNISMPINIAVGTHAVGDSPSTGVFIMLTNVNDGAVESISGTLTVTSKTANTIAGTFSFTGMDWDGNDYSVLDGQFNVQYQ